MNAIVGLVQYIGAAYNSFSGQGNERIDPKKDAPKAGAEGPKGAPETGGDAKKEVETTLAKGGTIEEQREGLSKLRAEKTERMESNQKLIKGYEERRTNALTENSKLKDDLRKAEDQRTAINGNGDTEKQQEQQLTEGIDQLKKRIAENEKIANDTEPKIKELEKANDALKKQIDEIVKAQLSFETNGRKVQELLEKTFKDQQRKDVQNKISYEHVRMLDDAGAVEITKANAALKDLVDKKIGDGVVMNEAKTITLTPDQAQKLARKPVNNEPKAENQVENAEEEIRRMQMDLQNVLVRQGVRGTVEAIQAGMGYDIDTAEQVIRKGVRIQSAGNNLYRIEITSDAINNLSRRAIAVIDSQLSGSANESIWQSGAAHLHNRQTPPMNMNGLKTAARKLTVNIAQLS